MQIMYKNPAFDFPSPCVSEITSAKFDEEEALLILYGYYNGKPAIFRIPVGNEGARIQMNHLYLEGRLSFYSHKTKVHDNQAPVIIDFFR